MGAFGVSIISAKALDEKREEFAQLLKRILAEDRGEAGLQKCNLLEIKESPMPWAGWDKIACVKGVDVIDQAPDRYGNPDGEWFCGKSMADIKKCPFGYTFLDGCAPNPFVCKKIYEKQFNDEIRGNGKFKRCLDTCNKGRYTVQMCNLGECPNA